MKIEKLNDYQIRCTLTREDLARRNLRLSELAYGTEKSRELFQEMMDQAADHFGFTTDDMPIMVEAIPYSPECLVLVISKCDDPEELDTRFANFAPSVFAEDEDSADYDYGYEEEDDFASLFSRIQEGGMPGLFQDEQPAAKKVKQRRGGKKPRYTDDAEYRVFSFPLLRDIIGIAGRIDPSYHGRNTLYKNKHRDCYMLLLHRQADNDPVFSQICLMLTEYGQEEQESAASEQFLEEHNAVLIRDHALQVLRRQGITA